jgi:aminocarboxymuconate-semialdehyde decarboxylase
MPLFQEMNARRCVLFLHPAVNGLVSPLLNDWSLKAAAGPLFEDATIAMHLMVKGIPARYPDIRIIVPHLGGGLAGMMPRLDNQLPQLVADLPEAPSATARRLWFDTVSHGSAAALRGASEVFGPDRLLAGSDFPVLLSFESYADTFGYVARAGLPAADAQRILFENGPKLLGV